MLNNRRNSRHTLLTIIFNPAEIWIHALQPLTPVWLQCTTWRYPPPQLHE